MAALRQIAFYGRGGYRQAQAEGSAGNRAHRRSQPRLPVKKRDALPQTHEGHGEHARRRRLPRSARSFKEGKGGFGKADYQDRFRQGPWW